MHPIQTKRLTIRNLIAADGAMILYCAKDESINRYLGFGSIATDKGASDYITRAIEATKSDPRQSYKLAMSINPSNEFSGSCWLDIEDTHSKTASIGYFVCKQHWGKGYATEMIVALIEFGFQDLGLYKIVANCDKDNLSSRHILEKVGMTKEGLLRQHCLRSYGRADVLMYGILEPEWKSK